MCRNRSFEIFYYIFSKKTSKSDMQKKTKKMTQQLCHFNTKKYRTNAGPVSPSFFYRPNRQNTRLSDYISDRWQLYRCGGDVFLLLWCSFKWMYEYKDRGNLAEEDWDCVKVDVESFGLSVRMLMMGINGELTNPGLPQWRITIFRALGRDKLRA